MKKISLKNGLWISGILALFSGFLNFYAAIESSASSSEQILRLVRSQLIYVLSQKDDMELIDWGNLLTNSNPGLSLQASLDDKVVIAVGRLEAHPFQAPLGFHFNFPNTWSFHESETLAELSGAQLNFVLSFPLDPNPWSLAALNGALALFIGVLAMVQWRGQNNLKLAAETFREPAAAPVPQKPPSRPAAKASPSIPTPYLRMDKGYLIRFVSPGVSNLFHKEEKDILEHHILDLAPQPGLLEILKKGQNDKISDAFLPPLRVNASLTRDNEDWVILLEAIENGQKH